MTEKQKYFTSLQAKFKKGLKYIGFIAGEHIYSNEEQTYKELNRMNSAPDLPDIEVLGKYSPKNKE